MSLRLRAKYALDRALALALTPPLLPPLGLIALAIWLDEGRPVFFCQERAGEGGRPFWIWKFRTLVPDAEARGGGYISDPAMITRVGRLLRATSLDELPQLLNVLRGDMSFVGPRPALLEQVARYTPRQRERLRVRPGITGWAQIHGRNTLPWSQRIEYDLAYVERAGPLFDLWIVLRTIPQVLVPTGLRYYQTAAEVDDLGSG